MPEAVPLVVHNWLLGVAELPGVGENVTAKISLPSAPAPTRLKSAVSVALLEKLCRSVVPEAVPLVAHNCSLG